MCKQSTGELIATARLHILTLAQELEKNGIFLESARIVRDDDENIVKCLLTWGSVEVSVMDMERSG